MAKHVITPAWQTSRGALVQAHGCAAGVPVAGAKVFGETRQNLWANPSGTQNGVTVTPTDDGALTLSGTASSFVSIGAETFALKPSTAYTLSMDKEPGTEATVTLNVREKRADGSNIDPQHNASTGGVTFTTSADMASCECRLVVISGTAVSGTYRVMLNEGSTAEPWCPPGLNGVDELSVVCAGKNLLARMGPSLPHTTAGITFSDNGDGGIRISGTATAAAYYDFFGYSPAQVLRITPGEYAASLIGGGSGLNLSVGYFDGELGDAYTAWLATNVPGVSSTGSIDRLVYLRPFLSVAKGNTVDTVVYPQLEIGSTATAYEPPAVTSTPIDLSGHQLRSLPDGTRDVLTVDGSGAVSVEEAVKCLTIDGTNVKAASKNNFQFSLLYTYRSVPVSDEGVAEIFCDSLPVTSAADIWNGSSIGIGVNASGVIVFAPPGNLSTIEDANTWLAQHPVTVIYPVVTTTTAPLDPIAPPSIPAPDATLWAASDVPCELEATTWTASGAEQGRQQAAMVALAQQVRQQAETVAALTTQALEA